MLLRSLYLLAFTICWQYSHEVAGVYTPNDASILHSKWCRYFTLQMMPVFYTPNDASILHSKWCQYFTLQMLPVFYTPISASIYTPISASNYTSFTMLDMLT